MKVVETHIKDLLIIEPAVFKDPRGYFFESYNYEKSAALRLTHRFVQDNQSQSSLGTLRGLHFQKGTAAQAKLVSVASGAVWDVAVDLRIGSPTYRQSFCVELNDQNFRQLLIPRGFAHGFLCLSEKAIFTYKCDNYYSKEHDCGIRFDDPDLNIDWPMSKDKMLISDKDLKLPFLKDIADSLCF